VHANAALAAHPAHLRLQTRLTTLLNTCSTKAAQVRALTLRQLEAADDNVKWRLRSGTPSLPDCLQDAL
jgi:hypothetical protein